MAIAMCTGRTNRRSAEKSIFFQKLAEMKIYVENRGSLKQA